MRLALVAATCVLAFATRSNAATANWLSNSGDGYTNTAAWSTSLVPGSADTAVIGNATQPNGVCVYTNAAADPASTNNLLGLQVGSTAGGTSTFTMNDGTLSITNAGGNAVPLAGANANGTFTMNGGVLNLVRNVSTFFQDYLIIGNGPNTSPWSANGTFTLNNGTVNCIAGIEIGNGGTGTININGGTFIDNGWFGVGRGGNATNSQAFVNITAGNLYLLRNNGTEGGASGVAFNQGSTNAVFTMSGGTLYALCFRFGQGTVAARTDTTTVNISGGDLYLSGLGFFNANGVGTHNRTINLSGGTFHTLNLGPNPFGTNGLSAIQPGGTNWAWGQALTANLNTTPGPGVVTFAPEAGRTITLNNSFNGSGGLTFAGPGTVSVNGNNGYSGPTLLTGGTLSGVGSIQGSVTTSPGTTISPGTSTVVTTLSLGPTTLNGNTNVIKLSSDPTQVGSGVNDLIAVNGALSLTAPVTIKIAAVAPLDTANPYTVLTYSGPTLTAGDAAKIHVISDSPRYNFTVIDPSTTPGSIQIQIGGNAANLVWKGGVAGNLATWDHTTTNWFNTVTSVRDFFFDGDDVTFDDTATTNLVNVPATTGPLIVTLANNSTPYTWIGAGPVSGFVDMEGSAGITLAMSNSPAFGGITNNAGPIIFNMQTPTYTFNAPISDNGNALGALVKSDTNTLILGGDNHTYTGTMIVTNGVFQYTTGNALGQPQYPLYITNGGTFDANAVTPGLKNIIISGDGFNGMGALINSSANALVNQAGINNITLAGNVTIGAQNRWDSYQSLFAGNGYDVTQVGPGSVLFVEVSTGIGNLHIKAGRVGFQGIGVDMGDPTKLCVVESNATLTFFSATNTSNPHSGESKVVVLNGYATFDSGGVSNNFEGPIFVTGTNLFGTRSALSVWSSISDTNGPGGITLGTDGVGASGGDLFLYGANTYSGPTIVTNRTLWVGASSSLGSSRPILVASPGALNVSALSSLTLGTGQVLAGNGTVTGNVIAGSGSTVWPGIAGSTDSLTLSGNLTLQSGSTTAVSVNKTTSVANSKVVGLASVTAAGSLVVNASGNALAGGDAIQIFSSTGTYGGNFTSVTPATPGTGLAWDTSTIPNDGTLRVLSTGPAINPTNIVFSASGHNLTLSWPTDHKGWTLQAQTNSLTGTWFTVPGSSSTNLLIIPIDPANTEVFYRMILNP
jgi:autotransporter-associated beta strand protein